MKNVTVFGGNGFLGRYVVAALARQGARIRVVSRNPNQAIFLKPYGELGQIKLMSGDITMDSSAPHFQRAVEGADVVINLVGVIVPHKKNTFEAVHVTGVHNLVKACLRNKVHRLVHVSALGVEKMKTSLYAQTKLQGEKILQKQFSDAQIIRPALMFGPEDAFFNLYGQLSRLLPVVPVIGRLTAQFQPVSVYDVAEAVAMTALSEPYAKNAHGKIYELGGEKIYTLQEIVEMVMVAAGRSKVIVPVPSWIAKIFAFVAQYAPGPVVCPDQLKMLKYDNVLTGEKPGCAFFNISPTPLELGLPLYLSRFKPNV